MAIYNERVRVFVQLPAVDNQVPLVTTYARSEDTGTEFSVTSDGEVFVNSQRRNWIFRRAKWNNAIILANGNVLLPDFKIVAPAQQALVIVDAVNRLWFVSQIFGDDRDKEITLEATF